MKLAGISIGDGWTDPINQVNYYDSYLWSVGVVESKFRNVCTWFQTNAIINMYEGNYKNVQITLFRPQLTSILLQIMIPHLLPISVEFQCLILEIMMVWIKVLLKFCKIMPLHSVLRFSTSLEMMLFIPLLPMISQEVMLLMSLSP